MAIQDIFEAVLAFDEAKVKELTQVELDQKTNIQEVLNEGLIKAMDEVGQRFSDGILFVPEMLMAAQAMKGGLEVLKPHLTGDTSPSRGTIVIGTTKGDLHDIGKNLVTMMMEGAGFQVIDLGVEVDSEKFIKAARENNADIVAISALLTTTMPSMADTITAIKNAQINVKTMVGGAPVTEEFAKKIGADGYGDDAPSAVKLARKLLNA
jgi:5-methyltetrahydrofolate--homocysteine methyltransferase